MLSISSRSNGNVTNPPTFSSSSSPSSNSASNEFDYGLPQQSPERKYLHKANRALMNKDELYGKRQRQPPKLPLFPLPASSSCSSSASSSSSSSSSCASSFPASFGVGVMGGQLEQQQQVLLVSHSLRLKASIVQQEIDKQTKVGGCLPLFFKSARKKRDKKGKESWIESTAILNDRAVLKLSSSSSSTSYVLYRIHSMLISYSKKACLELHLSVQDASRQDGASFPSNCVGCLPGTPSQPHTQSPASSASSNIIASAFTIDVESGLKTIVITLPDKDQFEFWKQTIRSSISSRNLFDSLRLHHLQQQQQQQNVILTQSASLSSPILRARPAASSSSPGLTLCIQEARNILNNTSHSALLFRRLDMASSADELRHVLLESERRIQDLECVLEQMILQSAAAVSNLL